MTDQRTGDVFGYEARERLNQVIVQVATYAATVYLIVLTTMGVVTQDGSLLVNTIAPAAVAASGFVMMRLDRMSGVVHLFIAAAGMFVVVGADGGGIAGEPLLGLLAMGIAGTLLVRTRLLAFVVITTLVIGVAGAFWQPDTGVTERILDGATASITFGFAAGILLWLRRQGSEHRLRLAALLNSKDEFVATVSHELRTPLTTIVGLTYEMQERFDDFSAEETAEFLQLLARESQDVANIVEDLLVAARSEVGILTIIQQPAHLVDELQAALKAVPFATVQINAPADLLVYADPGRTRQVLRNLLVNATRYGRGAVRVIVHADDQNARIEIRDDGAAIPSDERERIFEPYYRGRTPDGTPGSVGLGLTVSRRLARMMGGDIEYTHDGEESVFVLRLPLAIGVKEAAPEAASVTRL